MSTWFSWANAAPGVMVERIDAVVDEAIAPPVPVVHASAHKDDAVGLPPRPPLAARPARRRTDARRRFPS